MKRLVQTTISLIVSGGILYALSWHFDVHSTIRAVRQAQVGPLIAGLILMVLAYLLRGARWRIWERSLSYWDSLRLILIGFMGNNVLPARLGEVLRAHCATVKTSRERGRTTALASIAAERVLDGLVLAAFGLIGVALVPVDHRLRWALAAISVVFAGLGLGLVLSLRFHQRIRAIIATANRMFPGHFPEFARERALHLLDGLSPLARPSRMLAALVVTAVIWGIEVGCYYFVGRAVWADMGISVALGFLVVANFASLIPFTVGGIGTIEAAASFFLIGAGIPPYPALAMTLVQHAGQYLFVTIAGAAVYLAGGFHRIPIADPKGGVRRRSTPSGSSVVIEETRSRLDEMETSVGLRGAPRRDVELSIVIPAYNEQTRLPRTMLETIRWCSVRRLDFEVIVADDGSRDATLALGRLFEECDGRVRVLACPHMGKGATVRMGMLNAGGRFVLFMDADGATPLDEIPKLVAALDAGYDLAIGSRVVQREREVEVRTPVHRRLVGRVFAFLVNVLAVPGIADTQCGFKMFRRTVVREIFARQKTPGFAFDVEILWIARRLGLSIAEVPVNWIAQPGSKVNLITDSMRMLWDVGRVRWLHRGFESVAGQSDEERRAGSDVNAYISASLVSRQGAASSELPAP